MPRKRPFRGSEACAAPHVVALARVSELSIAHARFGSLSEASTFGGIVGQGLMRAADMVGWIAGRPSALVEQPCAVICGIGTLNTRVLRWHGTKR